MLWLMSETWVQLPLYPSISLGSSKVERRFEEPCVAGASPARGPLYQSQSF